MREVLTGDGHVRGVDRTIVIQVCASTRIHRYRRFAADGRNIGGADRQCSGAAGIVAGITDEIAEVEGIGRTQSRVNVALDGDLQPFVRDYTVRPDDGDAIGTGGRAGSG